MQLGQFTRPLAHALTAALMCSASASAVLAQDHDPGGHPATAARKPTARENELVQAVRDATERFKNVTSVAGPGEGYELGFGCVSGGDFGAMGMGAGRSTRRTPQRGNRRESAPFRRRRRRPCRHLIRRAATAFLDPFDAGKKVRKTSTRSPLST